MVIEKLHIPDILLLSPKIFSDKRGYFFESYKKNKYEEIFQQEINFIQDNESYSLKNTFRGFHFQRPPFEQTKLVRVLSGSVLDIAIDLRSKSVTYGKHIAIELNDKTKQQLYIPKGFAHGFVVLSPSAIISYKVDNYYSPKHEDGILFNDSELGINFNTFKIDLNHLILSEKDLKLKKLQSLDNPF